MRRLRVRPASTVYLHLHGIAGSACRLDVLNCVLEHNLTLQEPLYQLRSDTKDAFDEAKRLEARWKEVEREQRDVYQVR